MRTSNANAPGSHDFPADPSLEELNAKYSVVLLGGTVRVMHFDRSGMPVYQTIPDFIQFHHRRTKKDENDKPISVGKWWIAHPERRQHCGVVFAPGADDTPQLWYIDAFAGTGSRTVRVEAREGGLFDAPTSERVEQRRGSAQIAIDVDPKFDRLVFMDTKPTYCAALRDLADRHQDRDIVVVEGDANRAIQPEMAWDGWKRTRAVMFLDPYGMDVEWATLEAIAATEAIDVWFLFSLSGLYRQATRRSSDIDPSKRAAITRILGTNAWEKELYSDVGQRDLFDERQEKQRTPDVRGLERYVKARLETIFPKVFEPLQLPVDQKPQRFSLFLCISNSEPKALGLATRIADHILKMGNSS